MPANWYPNPENAAQLRYWDGKAWTVHTAPAQPQQQSPVGAGDAPQAPVGERRAARAAAEAAEAAAATRAATAVAPTPVAQAAGPAPAANRPVESVPTTAAPIAIIRPAVAPTPIVAPISTPVVTAAPVLTPPNSPPPTQLPPLRARSEEIEASAPQPSAPAPLASAPPVAAPEPTHPSPGQHQLPIASQPQHVPAPTGPRAKIGFFNGKQIAQSLQVENDRLNALIAQHGLLSVAELDATIRGYQAQAIQVQQDIAAQAAQAQLSQRAQTDAAHAELLNVRRDIDAARAHLLSEQATLEAERRRVLDVRATIDIQDLGLYDYEHPAEISATLGTSLESLRQQIKDAVRNKQAVTTTSGFTFNNSEAKGRKFVSDMSNILLRAYNAEAENCIKAVRAGNLHTAQARLSKVRDQIARQGTMISLQITEYYHHLRLQEMELASRHLQALQREKELERERREELREQRKAELELRKEQERLANERKHYLNALAVLQANGDVEGLERMQAKIADVDRAIADVDYRTANIRAGYVYVISNLGAFGGNMVKIGMTRRLEPMDRVNELGDASVPFKFDVHALFFAADAVGVESTLHKHFAEHRVNKVNLRREFFNVTPQAVLDALRSHSVEVLEFRSEAEAPEYRMSGAVLA